MRVSKDDMGTNYIWNYQIKILFSLKMKLFNLLLWIQYLNKVLKKNSLLLISFFKLKAEDLLIFFNKIKNL